MNVRTLEGCFHERIDREVGSIVDTVEDRIQNAIVTAMDSIITPKTEVAIRSINASSGRDATSAMVTSERGEHIGVTAPFENVSERNLTLHVFNTNDETQNNFPDEVSELSVSGAHVDRQPHTHHYQAQTTTSIAPSLRWAVVFPLLETDVFSIDRFSWLCPFSANQRWPFFSIRFQPII